MRQWQGPGAHCVRTGHTDASGGKRSVVRSSCAQMVVASEDCRIGDIRQSTLSSSLQAETAKPLGFDEQRFLQRHRGCVYSPIGHCTSNFHGIRIDCSDIQCFTSEIALALIQNSCLLQLGPNVSIGPNTIIEPGVRIRESIVLANAHIQAHSLILHSIIGAGSTVGEWARVEGTPCDPNPNKPFAKMENLPLFNVNGKLNPSITILGKERQNTSQILLTMARVCDRSFCLQVPA